MRDTFNGLGREELEKAISKATSLGAEYAEARLHARIGMEITLRNNELMGVASIDEVGAAIRVLRDGGLSFASTARLTSQGLVEAVERAVAQAKRPGLGTRYRFSEERLGHAKIEVVAKKPFDSMDLESKILLLKDVWEKASQAVRETKLVSLMVEYQEVTEVKEILTSDGGYVYSSTPRLFIGITATLVHPQKGSLQRSIELGASKGLEALEEWKPGDRVAEELARLERVLVEGTEPPKDPVPVVLGSEVVGLISHESAGHPMEADRIWGREAAQAGESYVKPEMIGRERIGNENATVVDDPTIPGSYGFYLYDEEAVPARPRYLYREGLLYEPLHNRWSAAVFGAKSNAAARAMNYKSEPIVRMANTYLTPGDYRFEELLEEAGNGVYIKSYMEWNIDDIRWGQRYVGLEAYMIRNGELAEPVLNPVVEFTTKWYYSSIKAKSRDLRFYAGICGKGEPAQGVPVWFGGPDVLLEPIRLGVAPRK